MPELNALWLAISFDFHFFCLEVTWLKSFLDSSPEFALPLLHRQFPGPLPSLLHSSPSHRRWASELSLPSPHNNTQMLWATHTGMSTKSLFRTFLKGQRRLWPCLWVSGEPPKPLPNTPNQSSRHFSRNWLRFSKVPCTERHTSHC
jgi:hypothetical protein